MLITVRTPPEDQTQEIIASPAYSSTDEVTLKYGDYVGTQNKAIYQTNIEHWAIAAQKLNLAAGTYNAVQATARVSFADSDRCDSMLVRLYEKTGTDLVYIEGTEVDITSDQPLTNGDALMTADLGDIEWIIEDGKEYYYVWAQHLWVTSDTGIGVSDDIDHPTDEFYWFGTADPIPGGPLPTTLDVDGKAYNLRCPKIEFEFTTSNRILYEGSYSAAAVHTIPYIESGEDYFIKFQNAVVADGEAFTCLFQDLANLGVVNTLETAILDMGATDQVTFNGNNIALAVGEAGQTFDLGANIRPDTSKIDLFYMDKTAGQGGEGASDIAMISHACKNGAARDLDYVLVDGFAYLNMSGTASVGKIQVGWEPVIIFGDSQAGTSTGTLQRLGAELPTAFTHDRMWWLAAISGNRLTATSSSNHTAGYQRYRNDTPGLGDITEMTGAILCFCSYCVNDISIIGTDETKRDGRVSLILQRISEIMYDRSTKAQDTLFIGQPPYDGTNASEQEAQAVRQFNRGMQGLAAATRTPFYTPWSTLVDGSYEVAIPVSNKTYIIDGNEPHYNTAGSQLVSANAVTQYELGTTPDRINQS